MIHIHFLTRQIIDWPTPFFFVLMGEFFRIVRGRWCGRGEAGGGVGGRWGWSTVGGGRRRRERERGGGGSKGGSAGGGARCYRFS